MAESLYIERIWKHLESLGATIRFDFSLNVGGQIHYSDRLILINEPNALNALIAIAHEGGHYLHFLRNPQLESNRTTEFREQVAYLLGWHLLRQIGAAPNIVSKEMWRQYGLADEYKGRSPKTSTNQHP